jgi:trigger factor
MKIELREVSAVKRRLVVEASPEEVERELEDVVRGWARRARLPGFRPGKAPLELVRARFAREIEEDVRERMIARLHREATEEKGVRPLGDPVLEALSHPAGGPLRFETSFEVVPSFAPRNYRGVEVREPPVRVEDEEVAQALEQLREIHARFVTDPDRKAAAGDFLLCDLEGRPEGASPFRRERLLLEVGSPDHLPAFDQEVLGAGAGEVREFTIAYPEDYGAKELAGRRVSYTLRVHEVKRKVLPALDDEFARDAGSFDTLEALRSSLRAGLEERKRELARREVRRQVLDKVLLENPIPLPEVLVEAELRARLEEIVRSLLQQGVDPRQVDLDWQKLRERVEEPARKSVHAGLVLEAVAQAEGIVVTEEEVEARIREEASRAGIPAAELRERLARARGLEALKTQILREKSLDYLTSVANIQSAG